MNQNKDFGMFGMSVGFKNMLLFYLAVVLLTAACIGLCELKTAIF